MPKQPKKEGRGIYPTYSWGKLDHDPIIDVLRARQKQLGYSNTRIQGVSRVSASTIANWGVKTRRPQFSTIAAVAGALDGRVTIAWAEDLEETSKPVKAFEPTTFGKRGALKVVGGKG